MHYHILRKLSEGGFSEVFEVRDPASAIQETLVLKRLSTEMSARPAVRRAFTKEGEFLSGLRHPNIVTFRRCYYDHGQICLVMEKVTGEDFSTWARRTQDEPRRVLDAFRQVLEAVDHLHHRPTPLLHLDLKPENILVEVRDREAKPVLIDFGIARNMGSQGLKAYTPPYAAPEQQKGRQLGCFTDVHALGQILADLLAILGPSLPADQAKAFSEVSQKARHPSRRRRYSDAGQFLRAFRQARVETAPQSLERRHFGLAAIVAVTAFTLFGIGAFLIFLLVSAENVSNPKAPQPEVAAPPSERAPSASSLGLPEACLPLSPPSNDLETVGQTLDICFQTALQSNRPIVMISQYAAAQEYLKQVRHDAPNREIVQQKVNNFKFQIDVLITADR